MTRSESARVVIVGTGFGGLAVALELKRAGHDDFLILEKADGVGGVWRDNTYPAAGCDIPSPYYSYSFAPNPAWNKRFSLQDDILAYIRDLVAEYDLHRHIRFGIEVSGAAFDDVSATWRIDTTTGDRFDAQVFVPAVGQLSRPAIPPIPGRDTFAGSAFHSARWDHDLDLTGKRVAVIGTGASAIQFVPQIQPKVAALTVFQRSAAYVMPKPDTVYSDRIKATFVRWPRLQRLERFACWAFFELCTVGIVGDGPLNRLVGKAAEAMMLGQLRRQVKDPKLRAQLTPDYPAGCKRALFSNNYYPALTRPNVRVDTDRVTEIGPTGLRTAAGIEYEVDVIIYGTGFAAQEFLAPIKVTGSGGRDLADAWSEGGRAYLGMCVPGFPNMFIVYGPNTNVGAGSIIYMHEGQATYIRQLVEYLTARAGSAVDVRPEVEQRYDTEMQQRLGHSVWTACASWYRAANGRVSANWPGLLSEYRRRTAHVELADFHTIAPRR